MKLKYPLSFFSRSLFSILFWLTTFNYTYSQEIPQYESLRVGDEMPDYTLKNLINYPAETAKISDFKGKLLIFDLWSTACLSCIESWPKLLKLQEEFEGQIQIILVNTYQDEAMVRAAIAKRKKVANVNMTLPSVCQDTVLGTQLFKHKGVPHLVWVDPQGIIRNITQGTELHSENIRTVLNDPSTRLHQKYDRYLSIDETQPLFVNGNGGNGEGIVAQSVLAKYNEQTPPLITKVLLADSAMGRTYASILVTSHSAKLLYAFAFNAFAYNNLAYNNKKYNEVVYISNWLEESRIIMQVEDPDKYESMVNHKVMYDQLYTYQLLAPPSSTKEGLMDMMQKDIQKYFNHKVHWEKRNVKCLVLTASDTSLISFKNGPVRFAISDTNVKLNGVTVTHFISFLRLTRYHPESPYPVIDETGMQGKVGDIELEAVVNDYKSLDKALQKYKMRFTLKEREIDVLVVSDPNYVVRKGG